MYFLTACIFEITELEKTMRVIQVSRLLTRVGLKNHRQYSGVSRAEDAVRHSEEPPSVVDITIPVPWGHIAGRYI